MIGFHLQRPIDNWLEAITRLPARAPVLAIDNVQMLSEAKAANPEVFTVLRHWYDEHQIFPLDWTFEQYKDAARRFFATFIDGTFRQHAANVDAVKEFNEYWANSQNAEEVRARLWWVRAACEVWDDEYRSQDDYAHIRLVVGSAAVGNDMPAELGSIAAYHDALVSYHGYWYTVYGEQPGWEWPTLSGRWELMDENWQSRGNKVDWLMTECGPFESAVTGWRSAKVCGGSVDCYLDSIRYWLNNATLTQAYREGRLYGGVLFNSGSWDGPWATFETKQPEMNAIAELSRQYTPAPPKPPPPPPPGPEPCRGAPRVQYGREYWVLSDDMTEMQEAAVFNKARDRRNTVGWSYDDAGIGDLDSRRVVLWNIPDEQAGIFVNWYAEHYPGVLVEFRTI